MKWFFAAEGKVPLEGGGPLGGLRFSFSLRSSERFRVTLGVTEEFEVETSQSRRLMGWARMLEFDMKLLVLIIRNNDF